MLVYWLIFLTVAFGALLHHANGRTSLFAFLVFAALPTVLMIGLRWEIGPDWPGYLGIFDRNRFTSLHYALTHQDPAYYVLQWALHRLHAEFWVLNLVCGLALVLGLTRFCREQYNPWLAFLIAFSYMVIVVGMSGNRQIIALGFLLWSLVEFKHRNFFRFTTIILVGSLFHGSVILMALLGLTSHAKNSLQKISLIVLSLALGYYFLSSIFYTYATRYSLEEMQSTGTGFRLAMNSLAALIYLSAPRRFGLAHHEMKLWYVFSLATLVLDILVFFLPSSTAVDRILLYLFPLQFVVFNRLPSLVPASRSGIQVVAMVALYAALIQFTFLNFATFSREYLPYRTIFDR